MPRLIKNFQWIWYFQVIYWRLKIRVCVYPSESFIANLSIKGKILHTSVHIADPHIIQQYKLSKNIHTQTKLFLIIKLSFSKIPLIINILIKTIQNITIKYKTNDLPSMVKLFLFHVNELTRNQKIPFLAIRCN